MNDLVVAAISAGSAVLASTLTAYISHRLEWRRRRIEENLRWLEERYQPAMKLLGRLAGVLLSHRDLATILEQVEKIAGKAWVCAGQLDPEDTGLRDLLLEILTYAHIAESQEELLEYTFRVLRALQMLSAIFREEREEILSGKSLSELIRKRKKRKEEEEQRFAQMLQAVEFFRDGKLSLDKAIRHIENSPFRGKNLEFILQILRSKAEESGQKRIQELMEACRKRGWI